MAAFRSSVRPLVTFLFVGVLCAAFLAGRISQDAFVPLAATVITFWFTSRVAK